MTRTPVVLVRIPRPLRCHTEGAAIVPARGRNVDQALSQLGQRYPSLLKQLFIGGELRPFVNIYLGSANIRGLRGLHTALEPDDILAIIPALPDGA